MARLGKSHYTVDDFNFSFGLSQSEQRRVKTMKRRRNQRGKRGRGNVSTPHENASDRQLKQQFVDKINHDLKILGSRQSLPAPPKKISHSYATSYVRGSYREDINLIEAIRKGNEIANHSKINTKGINLSHYWSGYMRSHFNTIVDHAIKDNQTFVGFSRRFRELIKAVIVYSYDDNKPAYNIVKYVLFG